MSELRIIFMGTPDFAVASLESLIKNNYNIVAVVTAPDKPAGRGQQIVESAVKIAAQKHGIKILQPNNLKDEEFLKELESLKPDLQIVVAFRMLPEKVWNLPRLGTYNLHASLLPSYRGAAPINWAIINGEKETGVTFFKLKHEIDTGNVLMQEKIKIDDNMSAGELHDKLMLLGAEVVNVAVEKIDSGDYTLLSQEEMITDKAKITHAPKIFKDDCKIDWNDSLINIHNKIRGLSPYPCAWTYLNKPHVDPIIIKVYQVNFAKEKHDFTIGKLLSENKKSLKVACNDGFIHINSLQTSGKKRMETAEFLNGFAIGDDSFFS